VLVIFFVAGITGHRGMTVFHTRQMAVSTFDFAMFAIKCKVRAAMVKQMLIEFCNPSSSAFVFGMACATFPELSCSSMESSFLFDVGSNFLMAGLAQLCLSGLVEWFMASLALLFVFGMPLDHIAWHQGRFQGAAPCW